MTSLSSQPSLIRQTACTNANVNNTMNMQAAKRTYSAIVPKKAMKLMLDDASSSYVEPTTSYMNKVGAEMENILSSASLQQPNFATDDIATSLAQLGSDVTDIKSTLQKKRPKNTLADLDEKLVYIISILENAQQHN